MNQLTTSIPCLLWEQTDNAKDKEHKKHSRVLKIIHVRRVQDPIDKELEMGRIQKLDTHINESTNSYNIKLQILEPPIKTRHRTPYPNSEGLGVGCVSHQRAPYVPYPDYKKQRPWQSMTWERTHLAWYIICNSFAFFNKTSSFPFKGRHFEGRTLNFSFFFQLKVVAAFWVSCFEWIWFF